MRENFLNKRWIVSVVYAAVLNHGNNVLSSLTGRWVWHLLSQI